MARNTDFLLLMAAGAMLAACDPSAAIKPKAADSAAAPIEMVPTGEIQTIKAEAQAGEAASVVKLKMLEKNSAHLFSTAGGDPAINGLYTHLAVWGEGPEGPTVYLLGNLNDWTFLGETEGSVTLKVSQSEIVEASGDVKTTEAYWVVDVPKANASELQITLANPK